MIIVEWKLEERRRNYDGVKMYSLNVLVFIEWKLEERRVRNYHGVKMYSLNVLVFVEWKLEERRWNYHGVKIYSLIVQTRLNFWKLKNVKKLLKMTWNNLIRIS